MSCLVIIKFYPQADRTLLHCDCLLNVWSWDEEEEKGRLTLPQASGAEGGRGRPEGEQQELSLSRKHMAGDLEVGVSFGILSWVFCQSPWGREREIMCTLDLLSLSPSNTPVLLVVFPLNMARPPSGCPSQEPGHQTWLLFGSHTPKSINPSSSHLQKTSSTRLQDKAQSKPDWKRIICPPPSHFTHLSRARQIHLCDEYKLLVSEVKLWHWICVYILHYYIPIFCPFKNE